MCVELQVASQMYHHDDIQFLLWITHKEMLACLIQFKHIVPRREMPPCPVLDRPLTPVCISLPPVF